MAKPPSNPATPGAPKQKRARKVRSPEAEAMVANAKAAMKTAIAVAKFIDMVASLDAAGLDKLSEAVEARKTALAEAVQS